MKRGYYQKETKKIFLFSMVGTVLILIFLIFSLYHFSLGVIEKQTTNTQLLLKEVSVQSIVAVQKQMADSQALLEEISHAITYLDLSKPDKIDTYVQSALKASNLTWIRVVDLEGRGMQPSSMPISVFKSQAYQDALNGKTGSMVVLNYLVPGEKNILFLVPIKKKEEISGILCGGYDMKRLSTMMDITCFDGQRYSHIMQANGAYIARSFHKNSLAKYDSIWTDLAKAKFDASYSLKEMREDVGEGNSGFVSYHIHGAARYAYFMPINVNGWFIVSAIPEEVMGSYSNEMLKMAAFLMIKVMGAFFVMLGILFFQIFKSKKKLLETFYALKISEERFRIAANQTDNILFDYDSEKKIIYHTDPAVMRYGVDMIVENSPESLVEKGVVPWEYAEQFCQMYYDIIDGAPKSSCVVKSQLCDDTYRWDKITLTNVFDEEGKPIRTIGTIENITDRKEAEIRYVQEEQYRKAIFAKSMVNYEFYLLSNKIIKGNVYWNRYMETMESSEYTCVMEYVLNKDIHPNDRMKVYETFCLSNLLELYSQGQNNIELEYRRMNENAGFVWVRCIMHLVSDLENSEIKGFAYVKDIDKEKKEMLLLKDKAKKDSLTGLYNRAETQRLVGETLELNKKKGVIHVFLIMDLDDFKSTNDQYGHIAGDTVLNELAKKMQAVFRKTDIIGRLGGDEFVALLKDIEDFKDIEDKVASLCNMTIDLGEKERGSLEIFSTIGIALAFEDGCSFMELYEKADKALYYAKKQGKARYAFYDEKLFCYN